MLNAVMALNPIVLIIGSIIILCGVIAAYINYTNRAKNETTSAVGVICGCSRWQVRSSTICSICRSTT